MDTLLDKIDKLLIDEEGATTTDNVEDNTDYTSKEKDCPEGEKW